MKLNIRAKFTTKSGKEFHGYAVGIKNIFCIVIFFNNEILFFNKDLIDHCLRAIEKINKSLEIKVKPEDFSPLKYQTTIDLEGYKNISGEFDIFKKRTDEERLSGI